MITNHSRNLLFTAILGAYLLSATGIWAQETETRIGPLEFDHGLPTQDTVRKLYDEMDFQRACQAYLWALPIVNIAQWQRAHEKDFGAADGDIVIYTTYESKLGILTPNLTTPYIIGFANLARTGPLVIDYPTGLSAGGVLDFWQRPLFDMGQTGPDKGAGAKYLVLGPGQSVADTSGYNVYSSPTFNVGMVTKTPGVGQAYLGVHRDVDGKALDGGKSYTLHIPPNPPAGQFWSVTIYDLETRRPVQNTTRVVDRSSRQTDLVKNADGSVDLYFGPNPALGHEANSLITVPGRAWFPLLRLYGPLQPYFDRGWPLPDIELVK
ncbi:MAG: DUF1214 domain-containing protein [Planctomycetota bacterium]|jgi:hypothetical protein